MRESALRQGGWMFLLVGVLLAQRAVADDDPPQTPPEKTPIGRFLGELIRKIESGEKAPARQREPQEQPEPDVGQESRIVPDAVDERALAGREQQRDLQQALRAFDEGDAEAGVTMLHNLLDAPEDTLLMTESGTWESLQQTIERVLHREDIRAAYVERFSILAGERLQKAKQSGDPREYAAITRRYLPTPAGQQAAQTLERLFRDLGEATEAAYWRARLDRTHLTVGAPPVQTDSVGGLPHTDWRQPFGGARHHGRFPATDPVLIEQWSVATTVRPAVAEQVQELVRDLVDSERACIPAALPLVVGDRIVCRTLRGLAVYRADDGELLWESAEGVSVERLLVGEDVPRPGDEGPGNTPRAIPPYGGVNADSHPLTGLLFCDGVYGQISSDGEQVFVLEEHASLSFRQPGYFWGERIQEDPFQRDWKTNQLVAYDLQTGKVRWRIGGEATNEPFDPPLAGASFMGPPVVDGDELFVIAEREGTLSLHVLERQSGRPLWSHAISEVGSTIDHDLVRRWWPAQPAVGAGVVVCPTTAGWMVAIDRLQRRIRWTYRYIEGRQKKVSSNRSRVATAGPLNTRWQPSAPILTRRHVLFTPMELPDPLYGDQPRIVCLDLLTGERKWWEPKDQNLYVGGVHDDRVVLVGTQAVEARELSSGKQIWQTPLTPPAIAAQGPGTRAAAITDSRPSGRGIIAGDEFLLPLQSGHLWAIDLRTGAVTRRIALRDEDPPLGNLLVWKGGLVSADLLSIRCFEQRARIIQELATATGRSPSPATLLAAAELKYLDGEALQAEELLRSLPQGLDPRQQAQAEALRWDTLLQIVSSDPLASDAQFEELAGLARTDQQRLMLERTRADRLLARGDAAGAFAVFWALVDRPLDILVSEGASSVHYPRWLAGRLERLWDRLEAADRERFDVEIHQRAEQQSAAAESARAWWSQVLRFHPAGAEIRRTMIEQALADERWTAAEILLLQLIDEGADENLQRWGLERLVQLMRQRDRPRDAATLLEQLAPRVPDGEALGAALLARIPGTHGPAAPAWSDGKWTLSQSAATFNRAMYEPALAIEPGLPSMNRLHLRIEPNLHRLAVQSPEGAPLWETPLQAQSESFYNHTTAVTSVGQLLLVVHRGVLQAVSIADRELLWQQEFDLRSTAGGSVRNPDTLRHQELRTVENFLWSSGLREPRTPAGMLAVWRPGYLAYFGRHSLTLADPLTGKVLWTRSGVGPRTSVYGTADMVLLVPHRSRDALALSVTDGSVLEVPRLEALVASSVAVTDRGLLQFEQRQPLRLLGWGKASVRVRLIHPQTGTVRAEVTFPTETRFAPLDSERFVAVDPDGAVTLLDARSGESRLLGSVGQEVMDATQRIYAIAEPGRVYLAFNVPPRPGSYSRSYQAAPVHGTLAAFDLRGGLLWAESIEEQNLITDQLHHLPVLVLSSQRAEREDEVTSQKVFVELRDKQTGALLLEDSRYITGGNVREMVIDTAQQIIDLNTFRDRLRLKLVSE